MSTILEQIYKRDTNRTDPMESRIEQGVERYLKRRSMDSVCHDPVTNIHYVMEDPNSLEPMFSVPIMDHEAWSAGQRKLEEMEQRNPNGMARGASALLSSTQIDELQYNPFYDEYVDAALGYFTNIEKNRKGEIKAGGVITSADYQAIANVVTQAAVVDLTNRDYVLQQAATRFPVSTLRTALPDTITPFKATGDLGETDITDTVNVGYAGAEVGLKKAQCHAARSRYSNLTPRRHDVWADTIRLLDADFPRIFAVEVAATMTSSFSNSASVAGAWDVIAGGAFHSTANPKATFLPQDTNIRNAGGAGNTLAMNSYTWNAMVQNTHMRVDGLLNTGTPLQAVNPRIVTHPLLPGKRIFIDELVANGIVFQYDSKTLYDIVGPTVTRTYSDDKHYIEGQIIDKWYLAAVIVPGLGIEITGAVT